MLAIRASEHLGLWSVFFPLSCVVTPSPECFSCCLCTDGSTGHPSALTLAHVQCLDTSRRVRQKHTQGASSEPEVKWSTGCKELTKSKLATKSPRPSVLRAISARRTTESSRLNREASVHLAVTWKANTTSFTREVVVGAPCLAVAGGAR